MKTWEQKPVQSRLVRAAAFALPMFAAIGAAIMMSRALPAPSEGWLVLGWWMAVVGTSLLTVAVVSRLARKLLPLSALLDLALAFPEVAPNRYHLALGAWSTRHMVQRMRQAQRGMGSTDANATAEFLLTLLAALGSHDASTRGHAERTRAYADLIATELKLSAEDRNRLRWVSLLHDIGKLTVPASLLHKKGPLEGEESTHLRYHPEVGFELTRPLHDFLGGWERAILDHHEQFNGRGYPNGIAGTDIALGARIVAVADAFDAMTSGRSYRTPMSAAQARKELAYRAGTQFDPTVVRAFLNVTTSRMDRVAGPLAALTSVPVVGWLRRVGEGGAVAAVAAVSVGALAIAGAVDLPAAAAGHNPSVLGAAIEAQAIVIDLAGADPAIDPASVEVVNAPEGAEAIANADGTITVRPAAGHAGTLELNVMTCDFSNKCTVFRIQLEITAEGEPVLLTAPPGVTARPATGDPAEMTIVALAPPAAASPSVAPTTTAPTTSTTATTTTMAATAPPTTLVITAPPPTTLITTVPPPTTPVTTVPPPTTTTVPATMPTTTVPTTPTTAPTTTVPTTPTPAPTTTVPTTTVPNAPPVAADDDAATDEDTPIAVGVLLNDSDEAPESLTITISSQPSRGTAAVVANEVVFTPQPDAAGTENFGYEICDLGGLCDAAKVTITIHPVNDAPLAIADTAQTDIGTKVRVKVLDNDSDVDGDTLRVDVSLSDTVSSLGGSVDCTMNGDKECEYDPPAGWDGSADSFTYVVTDGNGATATATVTITLQP